VGASIAGFGRAVNAPGLLAHGKGLRRRLDTTDPYQWSPSSSAGQSSSRPNL
jgi:hypothetical protein